MVREIKYPLLSPLMDKQMNFRLVCFTPHPCENRPILVVRAPGGYDTSESCQAAAMLLVRDGAWLEMGLCRGG